MQWVAASNVAWAHACQSPTSHSGDPCTVTIMQVRDAQKAETVCNYEWIVVYMLTV